MLFVSSPAVGHLFPMVPLAWALRAAGHEVLVATAADAVPATARAGLVAADVVPGLDRQAMFERMKREHPEQVQAMLHRRIDDLRQVAERFAQMSAMMVDRLMALAQRWQPDLIVQSQLQGAGLVAAAKLGVPLVDHGFGFARTEGMAVLYRQHMAEVFDRYRISDLPERHANIDVAPPSMLGTPPRGWSMRYVPYNGGAELPDWLSTAPERPRVVVTLGTVAPRTLGIDPVHRILELADGLDAEFVLALGDTDTGPLGPLPSNVRAAGWVPLHVLLPTCRAIVHHGGAGTTLTALSCGTPQLVLPTGADRHINADAVARRGAGLVVDDGVLRVDVLDALVHDVRLRAAAEQVREEITTLPAPVELVPTLATFAASRGCSSPP